MGIIVGSILLASIGVLNASQQVTASNGKDPDPKNKQSHSKDCDGDGDDGDCVSNTHKHIMNCDDNDDNCEGNSGSTVNERDSHFNQNCNTHRNAAATGDPDSDCKSNSHDKPANK